MAVRGDDHAKMAEALNWCRAQGGTLISAFDPGASVAAGASHTFNFKVWPRYDGIDRLWVIRMARPYGADTDNRVSVKVPASGTAVQVGVTGTYRNAYDWVFHEVLASQSSAIQDATCLVQNNGSTQAVDVQSIGCYEVPRGYLDLDTTEHGIDVESVRGGAPIYDGSGAGRSWEAMVQSLENFRTENARPGLIHWAVDTTQALTTTSTVLVDLFEDGGSSEGPPCLAAKQYRADTTKTVNVYCYAKLSGAGTGTATITMTNGATVNVTWTNTGSFAWASGTIAVDAEDLSAADGRRSSRWDIAGIQWKVSVGSITGSVAGVSIGPG